MEDFRVARFGPYWSITPLSDRACRAADAAYPEPLWAGNSVVLSDRPAERLRDRLAGAGYSVRTVDG
jgi:hypothetical protein